MRHAKMADIEKFIEEIPNSFKDVYIITEARKKYYISTLKIRLKELSSNLLD